MVKSNKIKIAKYKIH